MELQRRDCIAYTKLTHKGICIKCLDVEYKNSTFTHLCLLGIRSIEVSKFKGQMGISSPFGGFSAKECALPWLKLC